MERARNQQAPSVSPKRDAEVVFSQATDAQHAPQVGALRQDQKDATNIDGSGLSPGDDVSRYCPVCSQRLESRRCKLICSECGYYMSCADYY